MKLKILYILQFIAAGLSASVLILLPFISLELGLSLSQVGLVSSLMNISKVILILPVVFLANKYSNKVLIYLSVAIMALSFASTGLAHTYTFLILSIVAIGFGISIYQPLIKAELAREKESSGKKISNFSTIGQLGKLFINTALGYTILAIGWRYSALAYGIVPVIVIAAIIYANRKDKYVDINIENPDESGIRQNLNLKLIFALLTDFLDSIASTSVLVFLPFLLISKNFDLVYIPTAAAVTLVGTVLGKFVLGRLTTRYSDGKVFIISQTVMCILTLSIAFTNSIVLLMVLVFMLGMLSKGTAPVVQIMVGNSVANRSFLKKAFYLDTTVGNIGSLLATLMFGYIGDRFGVGFVFYGFALFTMLSILPAIGYTRSKVG